jgi:hypothetical protein
VTLNRARTGYDGSFTIDQYARDEVARDIGGHVTAARFTVD